MNYKAIGIMSGSSLDGLDIVFAEFQEQGGKWSYEILEAACYPFDENLKIQLRDAVLLNALDYQLLHTSFGHYIGDKVNQFIKEKTWSIRLR
jgi:anhydro-N-acetylmuramic acid kinase